MLVALEGDDVILSQITSQAPSDGYAVVLGNTDFAAGGLNRDSRIRPDRLFTADQSIIQYRAGHVTETKLDEVLDRVITILKGA